MLSSITVAVLAACGGGSTKEEVTIPPAATTLVALADSAVSLNDAVVEIDVLANDTADSGGALTLTSVTGSSKGEATIIDNKIRYVPNANFLGSDSFSYTMTSGSQTATGNVIVNGHQSLNLSGRVIDSPIADATVSVSINGETYTATADNQGFYQLSLLLTTALGDELIRLSAQGADSNNQGYVTLSSLTAKATDLLALRQEDNSVGREQDSSLQITQVTTAKDLLIKQVVGEHALTASQLAEAEVSLDAEKLIQTTAAIKLLVDDANFTLPDGYSTIEQFVADTAAFEQFISSASEGENSPISQAIAATLNDPDITPAAQPLAGRYVRVFDAPVFMTQISSLNIEFSDNMIYLVQDGSEIIDDFTYSEKETSISGSVITVIDPEESGHYQYATYRPIASLLGNQAELDTWNQQGCPGLVNVTTYLGIKSFTILEQTDSYFTATVDTFSRQVPDNPCQGITLNPTITDGQYTSRFLNSDNLIQSQAAFDLSQTQQWVLPDIKGSAIDSDLFTLNPDGSFDTLTGLYSNYIRTWSLSDDNKTLIVKITNPASESDFNQMNLHIVRELESAFSVLVSFGTGEPSKRYDRIASVLAVKGDGVVSRFASTSTTKDMLLSSVNSRYKEWKGRRRMPGAWFGWKLDADNTSYTPIFTCDGVNSLAKPGEVCTGRFVFTSQSFNAGTWQVKNNQLHIERGKAADYSSGACVEGEPCNLRVIVPLYESAGVFTGYEYNILSAELAAQYAVPSTHNNFQITPRVMHWTLQDLPL